MRRGSDSRDSSITPEFSVKPHAVGFGNPDVVVATLGAFEATNTALLLASIQRAFPHRPVLVTTTHPDTFDFFRVLEMGASDFLLPPLRRSELLPRLMRQARVTCRGDALVQKLKEDIGLKQIIGESPAFLDKVRCVPRFARCDATVLISGESGTGKELFARAIHYLSPRADRPFVPVNCGALPENLVESEIFGHKRGAFTGAASDQAGLIREAEGGTLFLDEIDCLTPQAQVKLLRFLQDGEYRSVGSQQILHANIRVIAAANADFNHIVRSGKFREDLFYRLNVLTLTLPPLRERPGDILLLTRDFLEKQAAITETAAEKSLARRAQPPAHVIRGRVMCANSRTCSCAPSYSPIATRSSPRILTCRRRLRCGRSVVPSDEIPCSLAIRARLSCDGSACA